MARDTERYVNLLKTVCLLWFGSLILRSSPGQRETGEEAGRESLGRKGYEGACTQVQPGGAPKLLLRGVGGQEKVPEERESESPRPTKSKPGKEGRWRRRPGGPGAEAERPY